MGRACCGSCPNRKGRIFEFYINFHIHCYGDWNMRYLRRKADDFLAGWKLQDDRFPLVIKGARQVGKTETIRHFAESNYKR